MRNNCDSNCENIQFRTEISSTPNLNILFTFYTSYSSLCDFLKYADEAKFLKPPKLVDFPKFIIVDMQNIFHFDTVFRFYSK